MKYRITKIRSKIHNPEVTSSTLVLATNKTPNNKGGFNVLEQKKTARDNTKVPKKVPIIVVVNMAKQYTQPKLYIPKEKEKPWYVWYRYKIPGTNKWRKFNVKKGLNKIKNTAEKRNYGKNLAIAYTELLKEGFNPFLKVSEMNVINKNSFSISEAFNHALAIKKKEVKETTFKDYESRIKKFENYTTKLGLVEISQVDKYVISKFLTGFSAKNSNNFRAAFSSIFSVLSDQGMIEYNFIRELRTKKETTKAIVIYSEKQIIEITNLLKNQDQRLLIYVQLISYMFWRPIEIVRLDLKNINLETLRMSVNTKGKDYKTKIIPELMVDDLKKFIGNRTKGKLFDLKAISDIDKRGHLTNLFSKFRTRNNIPSAFKSYHFRHTYITLIYLKLRQSKTKSETIEELSLITGHTSNAIWKYIKINDVELPKDYSYLIKE